MAAHRRTYRPTSASRPGRIRLAAAAAVMSVAAVAALTGCSLAYEENICSNGEYPVLAVGSTGSSCVTNGEEPPAGTARYPEGKVPKQVDDKWDLYWTTHTLDENGDIVDAPVAG
ncbi:SCO0607 family lipoprotein [Streptomyces sp. NPDC001858]